MITSEIIDLTPELATKLLGINVQNRPVSRAHKEKLEKAIINGEWQINGQPIIIFNDGRMGDGQHRCHAVIKTGISIKTLIIKGIDPATFNTIDNVKPRSAADILNMKGEKNANKLSAAARTYLSYFLKGREAYCLSTPQIEKCIIDHPHIRYWVSRYCGALKLRIFPAAMNGYLAIASEKHGIDIVELFVEQLATGVNLSAGSPALVLRERFLAQKDVSKLSTEIANAFMIKAINAHINGRKLTFLRHSEQEQFPLII